MITLDSLPRLSTERAKVFKEEYISISSLQNLDSITVLYDIHHLEVVVSPAICNAIIEPETKILG